MHGRNFVGGGQRVKRCDEMLGMQMREGGILSRARCSAQPYFAEPGPHEAPAFGAAPGLQRTRPQKAAP